MLKHVNIIKEEENSSPKFVKTKLITAERDGKEFKWEVIDSHDSVHILIDNVETKELLFVKQVRIPVLLRTGNGICVECCAGIVDKNIPLIEIAKEEVLEECGYDVPLENIKHFRDYKSSVGTQGTTCYTYFAKINESMKISEGGGTEGEDIEILRVPYSKVLDLVESEENIDCTTLLLLMLWLSIKEIK